MHHSRTSKSPEIKKSILAHLNKNRKQNNENSGLLDFVCLFSFKGENFSLAVPKVTWYWKFLQNRSCAARTILALFFSGAVCHFFLTPCHPYFYTLYARKALYWCLFDTVESHLILILLKVHYNHLLLCWEYIYISEDFYTLVFDTYLFIPNNIFIFILHAHNPSSQLSELSPFRLYISIISAERTKQSMIWPYVWSPEGAFSLYEEGFISLASAITVVTSLCDNFLRIRCRTYSAWTFLLRKFRSIVLLYLEGVLIHIYLKVPWPMHSILF